jgi:hypothetical protein
MSVSMIPQPEVKSMLLSAAEVAQAIGAMDAKDGHAFAPEFYYIRYEDKCNYAQGFASVRGPSYLTDAFLVTSEVASIEDDHAWIREGCW